MRKKLLSGLLASAMALTAAVGFSACGGNGDDGNNTGNNHQTQTKPQLPENPVAGTEGLSYKLSSDRAYYIVSGIGTCTATEIVIGNVYNGLPVELIDDYAFVDRAELTSVTISEGIEYIGGHAFDCCSGITSITIPNSVKRIMLHAFNSCSSLTNVTIGESVISIGSYAFSNCSALTSVTILNSETSILGSTFSGCLALTDIRFDGTKEQWKAIEKGNAWDDSTGDYTVQCTDGKLDKNGNEIE